MAKYLSDEKMAQFAVREVNPILAQLAAGQYRLALVQARYTCLCSKIEQVHGRKAEITVLCRWADTAPGKGLRVPTSARMFNGVPEVALFSPILEKTLHDHWQFYKKRYRQIFETDIVIGTIHELDHLALKVIDDNPSAARVIEGECAVWADTCEHAIRLFMETYKERVYKSAKGYYDAWLSCGKQIQSQQWRNFIASKYGGLRQL